MPYLLSVLLLAAVLFLMMAPLNKSDRRLDERITLRKQDKIPYGTWVAFHNLGYLFPKAFVYSNRHEPGYWDSLSNNDTAQALIIVAREFRATEFEMKRIISFIEHGNDVFVSTRYLSAAADKLLGCSSSSYDLSLYTDEEMDDGLGLSLSAPPFEKNAKFNYPGKKFSSYFNKIDSATTEVLGYDEEGRPDFIHLRAGMGNFYLQLEPLAFSNYFLLHKNNIGYYENALSVIRPDVYKVVWDEYYLTKQAPNEDRSHWLGALFRHPALKAALLTAIFALLLYTLMEIRRKQRYIPVITKPKNESLDFVKTVGRLYYDKGDHRNLCRKMTAYFLEYVRNRYKLATGTLDEKFIQQLQFKTGIEEGEIRHIVTMIRHIDEVSVIRPEELANFHKQLESFYAKT